MYGLTRGIPIGRKDTYFNVACRAKHVLTVRNGLIGCVVILADMQEINSFRQQNRGPRNLEKNIGAMVIRGLIRQDMPSLHIFRNGARTLDHLGTII